MVITENGQQLVLVQPRTDLGSMIARPVPPRRPPSIFDGRPALPEYPRDFDDAVAKLMASPLFQPTLDEGEAIKRAVKDYPELHIRWTFRLAYWAERRPDLPPGHKVRDLTDVEKQRAAEDRMKAFGISPPNANNASKIWRIPALVQAIDSVVPDANVSPTTLRKILKDHNNNGLYPEEGIRSACLKATKESAGPATRQAAAAVLQTLSAAHKLAS